MNLHCKISSWTEFMYSHVLVLFFFSFIWNIIAPKEVLQYLKGQSFKTIRVLGLSLNLKKFRGKSPMHSSGQMPHVCMYGPLSITRLHHVSWWLPELRRSAFSSSLTQVCDLSLWGVTSQRAPTSTGHQGLPLILSLPRKTVHSRHQPTLNLVLHLLFN